MSLNEEIASLASSLGADLVGVAPASVHTDYIEEVRARIQETGATERDFMLPEDAMTFFGTLADVRRTLPSAKSLILLGVYAFDGDDDYKASKRELRGKTAKIYNYYPVARQIVDALYVYCQDQCFLYALRKRNGSLGIDRRDRFTYTATFAVVVHEDDEVTQLYLSVSIQVECTIPVVRP